MSARLRRVLISALVLTGLWQLLAMWVGHSFILPAPLQVISAMLALLKEASFYSALSATSARCSRLSSRLSARRWLPGFPGRNSCSRICFLRC